MRTLYTFRVSQTSEKYKMFRQYRAESYSRQAFIEHLRYRYSKFSRFEIDEALRKHKIIIVTEGFRYDNEE